MAFVQAHPGGDFFINIGQSVGRGKANTPNDVLVVQALLEIVYNSPKFKKRLPGGRPAVASSTLQKDTPALIADFQRLVLKRAKPQGFCDPAPDTNSSQLDFNTLFRLWGTAELIDAALNGGRDRDVLARLQREHPSLRNLPQRVSPTVIRAPQPREPRLLDASH